MPHVWLVSGRKNVTLPLYAPFDAGLLKPLGIKTQLLTSEAQCIVEISLAKAGVLLQMESTDLEKKSNRYCYELNGCCKLCVRK